MAKAKLREDIVPIRMSATEKRYLTKASQRAGGSLSTWIRMLAVAEAKKVLGYGVEDEKEAR